jgi:ketosteroid isomerase-like protein
MKKIYLLLVISVFLTINLYTDVLAGNKEELFKTEINKIFESWRTANLNADFDLWFSNWDENAIKMASNRSTVYGKSEIGKMKRKMFQNWKFKGFDVDVEEIQLADGFGYARGTYKIPLDPKVEGTAIILEGTFLTVFKKQSDGSWKIYRDCMMSK